ncbi:MAG: ComEC/Rec2 family competence protein [Spirosomataceae bacterium]
MVLGLRDEMDNDLVQAYSAAGAVHVLSVSGFHIAIFMGILTFLLGFFRKSKHGKWLYLSLTFATMWFYALLTGLSAPVIRSALMFSLFLLAKPLGRKKVMLQTRYLARLYCCWSLTHC